MILRSVAILALVAALAACGGGERELAFKFGSGLPDSEVRELASAARSLVASCPGVARYWGDLVQNSEARFAPANLSDERDRGWKKVVRIELSVAERPQAIPPAYKAAGHRCYYDVGLEHPAGVSIAKAPCVAICLDKQSSTPSAFVSNPG